MTTLSPLPVNLEIHNLRSFSGPPAHVELSGGFTALLGINNAGKSSLLRMFWELRPAFTALVKAFQGHGSSDATNLLSGAHFDPMSLLANTVQLAPGERLFPTKTSGDLTLTFRFGRSPYGRGDMLWPSVAKVTLHRDTTVSLWLDAPAGQFPPAQRQGQPHVTAAANVRGPGDPSPVYQSSTDNRADIEPIRDVATFLARTMYVGPFRNAINVGAGPYFDIQIGDAFVTQLHAWKSGPNPKHNEAIYRMAKELQRIFEFEDLEINPAPDGTLQLIIDGFSYRSSEIGAGFAHFLLVAANVLTRRPTLLLIDEPELNLHPALQLDFLTLLGSYTSAGVVFATHSPGLARAAADRVYCVTREAGVSQLTLYEETPGLAALTGQLGFGGRTDLQFYGVLLVEGVTEVKTFQQLLRLYGQEHRWVIVPLAGENLIKSNAEVELAELRRISDRIVAVIDSERSAAGEPLSTNRSGFAQACNDLSIACTVLDRRAIENYFPGHAVQAVYGPGSRALSPYERPREAGFSWSKSNNWRVARKISKSDLQGTDLATLLESLTLA